MSNATHATLVGRLVTDPETRVTQAGDKVANFRVLSQERRYDKDLNTWVDGDRLYATVACWRGMADHAEESLRKGDQVVVTGRVKLREWRDKDDNPRMDMQVDATAVGPDLARHTVTVLREDWSATPARQRPAARAGPRPLSAPDDTAPETEAVHAA